MAYNWVVKFEWDEAKNQANKTSHGVTFEDARVVFQSGSDYLEIFDEAHSVDEDRFIAIGPASRGILMVVWTEPDDDVIRIISARQATRKEAEHYRSLIGGKK